MVNWNLVNSRPQLEYIPENCFTDMEERVRIINDNTTRTFQTMWDENVAKNLEMFNFKELNVKQLKDRHKDEPALLVGAGPSLKQNIGSLKGKGVIYASAHSLKFLLSNGVKPDYVVVMDAQKKTGKFFKDVDTSDLTLISGITVHNDVLREWKGRIYFFRCDGEKYDQCGIDMNLTSGGSVMGAALNLSINMGAKKIIFVGMDLSMPITSDAYNTYADGFVEQHSGQDRFITSDISGCGLWTLLRMWMYKLFIENVCYSTPHVEYVNATESGILGAFEEGNLKYIKQMKLVEV